MKAQPPRTKYPMQILSTTYAILVVLLSVAVLVAVWFSNKERIRADLRRLARALHLRR